MAHALYGIVLGDAPLVIQDGVGRIALVGAVDVARAGDGGRVAHLGAALGDEQVVPPVAVIYVGRLGMAAAVALPYAARGRELATGGGVYLTE